MKQTLDIWCTTTPEEKYLGLLLLNALLCSPANDELSLMASAGQVVKTCS